MAREAKAKAASCWLDRIMVTGAVMRHRTWGQNMFGVADLPAQTRAEVFPRERVYGDRFLGKFPFEKDPKSGSSSTQG